MSTPTVPAGPVGAAIATLGRTLAEVGESQAQQAEKRDRLRWSSELLQFEQQWNEYAEDAGNRMEPGAPNFTSTINTEYRQRAKEFIRSAPPGLRQELDLKLLQSHNRVLERAREVERAEQDRHTDGLVAEGQSALLDRQRNRPDEWQEIEREGEDLIRSMPSLSRVEQEERIQSWRKRRAHAHAMSDVYSARDELLPEGEGFVSKVIGVESGGNATARPRDPKTGKLLSSAYGAGQFTEGTWLATIRKHRPDIAEGRSTADLLEMRADAGLSREMTAALAQDNASHLRSKGLPVNDGTLYLAHFAGAGGAEKILKANPGASAESVLGSAVVKANAFLKDMTASDVRAWAARKMGAPNAASLTVDNPGALDRSAEPVVDPRFAALDYEERLKLHNDISRGIATEESRQATARKEALDLGIETGEITNPAEIIDEPSISDGDKAILLRRLGEKAGRVAARNELEQTIVGGGYVDPYDTDTKKALDSIWSENDRSERLVNGDAEALADLHWLYERSGGMVPKSAGNALRAMLGSRDVGKVTAGLSALDSLFQRNPHAFKREFDEATVNSTLRYAEELQSRPAGVIAREFIEAQDPVVANAKEERRKQARELSKDWTVENVRDAFNASPIPFTSWRADAPLDPVQQSVAVNDYRGFFERAYADGADESQAAAVAGRQMALLWSPSVTNGGRLTRHPPEFYYQAVDGSHEWMRDHLETELKAAGFASDPIPQAGGERILHPYYVVADPKITLGDISAGRPPRYRIFVDKNMDGFFEDFGQPFSWREPERAVIEQRRRGFEDRRIKQQERMDRLRSQQRLLDDRAQQNEPAEGASDAIR